MKMRTIGLSLATRAAALTLAGAIVTGCSGTSRLLPAAPGNAPGATAPASLQDVSPDRGTIQTFVRIRIPRGGKRPSIHPSSISSLTHSVSIAVNTSKARVFNATPSSPGCVAGTTGLTCTFAMGAPAGTDNFTVTTYSGINATGAALDRGITAKILIVKGKANKVLVKLGPLVTNTGNSGVGSLRYAVATANAGDTITFLLAKGSTITLSSPITLTGTLSIAGPGSSYVAVSGGGTHQIFQVAGTATISGLALAHGKAATASEPGGAIQNVGALTLAGDIVGSSTSVVSIRRAPGKVRGLKIRGLHPHCSATTYEGGAVYNDGALTVSGTTFTGNVVRTNIGSCITGEGGAIFNDLAGTLSSTNDTYDSNSAALGGAVYNAGAGGVTFTNDTFTGNTGCTAASGCPTTSCGATNCASFAIGEGAAIYDAGVGITVTGSKFISNVAGGKTAGSQGQGGAIYLNSALPSITGSTFTSNLAGGGTSSCSGGEGGAIFAMNAVEIDNDTFKDNTASGDNTSGGGAIVSAMSISGTGDVFTGNTVSASGGACTTNAQALGGAAYAGTTLSFSGSTFTGNAASSNALAAAGAVVAITIGTISNCTFTSNTALATGGGGAGSVSAVGGAALFGSAAKISGSTFTANAVTAESAAAQSSVGGAAAVESGSLFSTNNTFASNTATMKNAAQTAAGGGLADISGLLVSSGDKFSSNSVAGPGTAGGGAVFAAMGALMNNVTMTSNKVSGIQAVGGALALGTSGELTHVTATGNSAISTTGEGGGGGIYDVAGSSITDSSISQNTATTAGGGIFSMTNVEIIVDSSINNNVVTTAKAASAGGGGIYEANGIEMSQDTVAGNTVTVSGPGPAGAGGILNGGGLLMVGSTISGNKVLGTAPQGGGGGILSDSEIIAINNTISSNSSSIDGGGVENAATSGVEFANSTFFQNAANSTTGHGGNIANLAGAALTLTNSVVGGGTAGGGADVFNAASATLTSGGYDIFGTHFAGSGTYTAGTGDELNTNPQLLPLSNNGGPTFTNADKATSPGKGHIPYAASACNGITITTDQRGFTRGAGGRCDVGAYEYAGVATAIVHRPLPKRVFHHMAMRRMGIPLPHIRMPKLILPE
ncbi:MAG TPA: choice-of-anchor Q domain-containing protein [Candidatus Baltobacteraceae bacterium]|nr:choice-of-anchor Q domain-containing protein [Candidatus Baltobacteraceae bacterium]